MSRRWAMTLWAGAVWVGAASAQVEGARQQVPTVGMEASVWVTVPGPTLEVVALPEDAPLRVAIATAEAADGATRYQLRYTGLVAEDFDLARYLRRIDGSTHTPIPPIRIVVAPLLRPGELLDVVLPAQPRERRPVADRTWLYAALVGWVSLLVIVLWWRRRQRSIAPAPHRATEAFAELRSLAALAAEGRVTEEGRARLERLLIGYWRARLDLGDSPPADALRRLLRHEDSGPVLRAVRDWAHHPDRPTPAELASLLREYAREDGAEHDAAGR